MLLSKETLHGIRMTGKFLYLLSTINTNFIVHSFVDLAKHLLALPGVKFFLSERLSQDPLEKFFGRQRQRGRANVNPNVAEALKSNQALRVINSINLDTARGNTRGTNSTALYGKENQEPLPKRRRVRKSIIITHTLYTTVSSVTIALMYDAILRLMLSIHHQV